MLSHINEFSLWPLRGAIAVSPRLDNPAEKFMGRGVVEAALIEKSALKGLRLFVTHEALRLGDSPVTFAHRSSMVRGTEHHEVNWLANSDSQSDSEYEVRLCKALTECANHLLSLDSNYCCQLGSSLKDLLRWKQSL
jgi:hypothetical protein